MFAATLIEKKWLYRRFEVLTPHGVTEVIYDGRGIGYESVLIEGQPILSKTSVWWYIPEFSFNVGEYSGEISVRVWAWLSIKSLSLQVDNQILYSED